MKLFFNRFCFLNLLVICRLSSWASEWNCYEFVPARIDSLFSNTQSYDAMWRLWGILLKAGPCPSGPKAQRPATRGPRPGGKEARWPGSPVLIFHSFFFPRINPRAWTDLHRVCACKMDDSEFQFVYHFNNNLNPCFSLLHGVSNKNVFILGSFLSLQKPIAQ